MKHDLSLSPFGATIAELVSAARLAESEGFDAVWTYDHVSGISANTRWVLDPWITLTAIAVATERLHLGPLVLNATIRLPAHVAVAAATLQEASGGRLMVGMGAGAGHDRFGAEVGMIGLPRLSATERRDRTEEAVTTVRALWRGASELDGTHHTLRDASGFLRPDPEPLIVVGVNGPKMSALAGRVGDAVNIHGVEDQLERLADVARESSGNPDFPITVEAPLSPSWLSGHGYGRLVKMNAARVMYQWSVRDGLEAITAAASQLGDSGA